jgi:hypothetical protein
METLKQIPKYTPLSIFGSFETSNPTCPVTTLTVSNAISAQTSMCSGNCFDITLDWIDDDLSILSGDFTVTMNSVANA